MEVDCGGEKYGVEGATVECMIETAGDGDIWMECFNHWTMECMPGGGFILELNRSPVHCCPSRPAGPVLHDVTRWSMSSIVHSSSFIFISSPGARRAPLAASVVIAFSRWSSRS